MKMVEPFDRILTSEIIECHDIKPGRAKQSPKILGFTLSETALSDLVIIVKTVGNLKNLFFFFF